VKAKNERVNHTPREAEAGRDKKWGKDFRNGVEKVTEVVGVAYLHGIGILILTCNMLGIIDL
jgi:hypothetical protein